MSLLKKWREKIVDWLKKQQANLPSAPSVPTVPGQWPQACAKIKAAMVTPMFVYADAKQVASQCDALRNGGYNAVASLVDLQAGRSYIIEGRTRTELTPKCRANVEACLEAGLTPVLIIRNDWAVRTKCQTRIPSLDGPAPASAASFYSSSMVAQEKAFIDSIKDLFPYVHIQLSIECQPSESADFALVLSEYLRNSGFTNQILINPYAESVPYHESIRGLLDKLHVRWARSHVGTVAPVDPVWNTDGDQSVTAATAKTRIDVLNASQKDWILWGVELKDCPNGIPEGYLVKGASTPSTPTGKNAMTEAEAKAYAKTINYFEGAKADDPKVIAMLMRWGTKISHFGGGATPTTPFDETNLWKPVAASGGMLAIILAHSCNCESVTVGGERLTTRSIGAGFRHIFRASKPGAAYGNAKITIEGAGWAQISNGGKKQSFEVKP